MANGYLMLSERNLKRESFDGQSSDFNTYVLSVNRYKFLDDGTGTAVNDTLAKIFPKVMILDKGNYRASDGSTYAMRELNFPVRLHFGEIDEGEMRYIGDSYTIYENDTQYTITPYIIFSLNPDTENSITGEMSGDKLHLTITFDKRAAGTNN